MTQYKEKKQWLLIKGMVLKAFLVLTDYIVRESSRFGEGLINFVYQIQLNIKNIL